MKFGLTDKTYQLMLAAFRQFPEIESVEVFGSRAMGNCKPGSDVDLVLKGEEVTAQTVVELSTLLNEKLPIPYFFDIVSYQDITEPELKNHIDEHALPVI